MYLKKISLGLIIILTFAMASAQQIEAIELVKILYSNEIDQRINFLKEFKSDDSVKLKVETSKLYKDLAKIYDSSYSKEELVGLSNFYLSPIGQKLLTSEKLQSEEVYSTLNKWEAIQQGIDIEDIEEVNPEEDPSLAYDESENLNADTLQQLNTDQIIKKAPTPKSLEDLRNFIKNDHNILFDSFLLAEILDLKEIIEPITIEERHSSESGIEKKKSSKEKK